MKLPSGASGSTASTCLDRAYRRDWNWACHPAHRTNAGRVPTDRQGSVHSTTPGANEHPLGASARRNRWMPRCVVRGTACEPAWGSKPGMGLRRVRIGRDAEIAFSGLVYIWGRPTPQTGNATSTRDRGDGMQAAFAPRVRMPSALQATAMDPGTSEC